MTSKQTMYSTQDSLIKIFQLSQDLLAIMTSPLHIKDAIFTRSDCLFPQIQYGLSCSFQFTYDKKDMYYLSNVIYYMIKGKENDYKIFLSYYKNTMINSCHITKIYSQKFQMTALTNNTLHLLEKEALITLKVLFVIVQFIAISSTDSLQ